MTGLPLHSRVYGKRRGECLPGRLRIAAHCGVTLVELMMSMLILAIVCIAWLQIIGIQSARKEARRREAVERLSGMMDAFMYEKMSRSVVTGSYSVEVNTNAFAVSVAKDASTNVIHPVFGGDVSPIGYRLCVVTKAELENYEYFGDNWGEKKWLVGALYNSCGTVAEAGKPFFVLPVCLGF